MKPLIQICGDPTVDWFRIYNEEIIISGGVYYWKKTGNDDKVRLSSRAGGSARIVQLANEMVSAETVDVQGTILDEELLNRPKDHRITTSWTVWREFPNPGFNHTSFRLEKWHEFEPGHWDYSSHQLKGFPDLLVIQDTNLGFRMCKEGWPEVLSTDSIEKIPQDIIIQLGQYNDGEDNPLLNRIIELGLGDRTTIITSISDLRSCAIKIGLSLSWEKILEEVVNAVLSTNCPFVTGRNKAIKYKQIIVTLGASGAIIIGRTKSTMIFDRSWQEGDFASQYPGQVMGYHACLLGALITTWAKKLEIMDWIKASCIGIKLARKLHIIGYEVIKENDYKYIQFPCKALASFYQELNSNDNEPDSFLNDQIDDLGIFTEGNDKIINKVDGDNWTILEEKLVKNQKCNLSFQDPQNAVIECARNIVLKGPLTALPDVPVETIGSWYSADRQEIEGVRSVKNAMQDYLRLKRPKTPLCVAVFGPPGSGKSFVVKEIAKGLGIREDAQLTFNLSQFESSNELQSAFHQIRDLNLQGKMPLAFWDEFDTPFKGQNLGWLRYFLAPMQDGEFSNQGVSHPLGGGIYVFAGATRHSFDDFQIGNNLEDRTAKKPDFISRLRAYINIRGINGNPNSVEDRLYMIRRAFVLRQYLEINAPQIRTGQEFVVEKGVLDALLRVTKYYHGARSLENLIKVSRLAEKRKFELSSLPPDNIVSMHANINEFNDLTIMGDRKMLRIGITGHTNLDPNQIENLEQVVDEAINFIEQQFPEHYLTVFSPLAAGADRLIARQLLKRTASRLIAILPVPQVEYMNDFGSSDDYQVDPLGAELRQELKYWLSQKAIEIIELSPSPTKKSAYIKTGNFIAEHSDILMVIWDGKEQKDSSITAQIVAKAEELNKPICHIWGDNFNSESIQINTEEKCGLIRYKNFPCHRPGKWN